MADRGPARPSARRVDWSALFTELQSAYANLTLRQFELTQRLHAARQSGELLQEVVDSMSEALFVTDRAGRIILVNSAAAELTGFSREALLARGLPELVSHPQTPVPPNPWKLLEISSGSGQLSLEAELITASGRGVPVGVSWTVVRDARGAVTGMMAVARDMRQIRELISRLEEALQVRDQFLATAAHELRTPLTALLGHVQLLERQLQPGEESAQARSLSILHRQVKRLTRLVSDMLDLSRLTSGRVELRRQPVELVGLIRRAAEEVAGLTDEHEVRLMLPEAAWVSGDAVRLEQVMGNLLSNAVKFSPAGGLIEIRARVDGDRVTVSVRDEGVGIPRERRRHLFERFYRAHAGTPYDFSGMGIGLNFSREVVRQHGGEMGFESREGQGSTFFFQLPLLTDEEVPAE